MLNISTLEKLKSETAGRTLSFWQVAGDGQWEKAFKIETADSVDAWLGQAPDDVAVEAFFSDDQSRFFFIGVRLTALSPVEKSRFLKYVSHQILPGSSFETAQEKMSAALGGAVLFDGQPDLLELGVEGLWKSSGAYTVWDKTEGLPAADAHEVAHNAAHLTHALPRPLMLEFAWKKPYPHWIGLQTVSLNKDGSYLFCPDTYTALTTAFR